MNLIIDRKRWLRGGDDGQLLRPMDGKMCCLGFFALACGYRPTEIQRTGDPEETARECGEPEKPTRWPRWLLGFVESDRYDGVLQPRNSASCDELISANDSSIIPDPDRETRIAAIFARHGVTVRFVDEPEGE
jgi:hypothetical protein